ncbi:ATP-binding protein [Candidatus Methylomirabilis sp.]|uniref:ATP-binding protein n=1 Tax=Candidatus Methylomirabilis sp. TaxID=2032687 RepID=UPI003C788E30
MRLFRDVPIQKKLRRITMLTTSVALLLTGVALIVYELVVYRSVMTRELVSLADVIGANSAAALTFNDPKAAEETLSALRKDSRITLAAIYTKEGKVFAAYRRQQLEEEAIPVVPLADGSTLEGGRLIMFHPIILDQEKIGTLYIQADTREAYARLRVSAMIVLGVLLASSLVALMLASILEGVISQPILNLAHTAAIVSETQDYSVRVAGSSQDELGQLIDGFNEMLAQVQRRDIALQEARNQLEATVEERTRELQEAKQRAEEASRHKSLFLSNMSHELRTPLNSILGFAWLLQDPAVSSLNEQQARFARNIAMSGEHLLALINDLLDLSKVEAGKLVLQLHPFPLQEAIEAAIYAIRPQAEQKQQVLELALDGDMPVIEADPTRFRQILYNLLANAVKFTPAGGRISVTAKMVSRSESGVSSVQSEIRNPKPETASASDFVEIAVSDTGIGIKREDLAKLFQTFTQLDSALTKQFQGTGLGLALTKQLVGLHGGSILAASEGQGRGSTFTVWLPLLFQERPETGG